MRESIQEWAKPDFLKALFYSKVSKGCLSQ